MAFAKETKIFDPADGFGALTNLAEVTDSTVAKRGNRWWMYLAGSMIGHEGIHLFSASLPEGAPLALRDGDSRARCPIPLKWRCSRGRKTVRRGI